jgi:hypothetical protein
MMGLIVMIWSYSFIAMTLTLPMQKIIEDAAGGTSTEILSMTLSRSQLRADPMLISKKLLDDHNTTINNNMVYVSSIRFTPKSATHHPSHAPVKVLTSTTTLDDGTSAHPNLMERSLSDFCGSVLKAEKMKGKNSTHLLVIWKRGFDRNPHPASFASQSSTAGIKTTKKTTPKQSVPAINVVIIFNAKVMNGTPYGRCQSVAGEEHHESVKVVEEDLPMNTNDLYALIEKIQKKDIIKNGGSRFQSNAAYAVHLVVASVPLSTLSSKKRNIVKHNCSAKNVYVGEKMKLCDDYSLPAPIPGDETTKTVRFLVVARSTSDDAVGPSMASGCAMSLESLVKHAIRNRTREAKISFVRNNYECSVTSPLHQLSFILPRGYDNREKYGKFVEKLYEEAVKHIPVSISRAIELPSVLSMANHLDTALSRLPPDFVISLRNDKNKGPSSMSDDYQSSQRISDWDDRLAHVNDGGFEEESEANASISHAGSSFGDEVDIACSPQQIGSQLCHREGRTLGAPSTAQFFQLNSNGGDNNVKSAEQKHDKQKMRELMRAASLKRLRENRSC